MYKLVYVPLDERPCNYNYPQFLYKDRVNFVTPSLSILGDKRKEANVDELISFLKKETKDADALVIPLDMLLYGGLLPSRIHYLERDVIEKRLNVLKELKEANPSLLIYSFVLIMRCPSYSSSEEEPMYYDYCGAEIHKLGALVHKQQLGLENNEEEIERLKAFITDEYLNDFLGRRANNISFVKKAIDLRKSGVIDYLIIPQDDSAPYGYTALDQITIREKISEVNLTSEILMYPGTDEVGLTLLSRAILNIEGKKPKVFIKYASENAFSFIPGYEDRPLGETVKYHIMSAGGRIVSSYSEADVVLCFTSTAGKFKEARYQNIHSIEYDCFRNLPELIDFIKDSIKDKKPVLLCDNAYSNGGDLSLLSMLNYNNLLGNLASIAGWNTNANSLGTTLSQGFLYYLYGESKAHFDFLALRYIEDYGYDSVVRFNVADNELKKNGFSYFDVKEQRGLISKIVEDQLNAFKEKYLSSISKHIVIHDVYMPWRRMFEAGLTVSWEDR